MQPASKNRTAWGTKPKNESDCVVCDDAGYVPLGAFEKDPDGLFDQKQGLEWDIDAEDPPEIWRGIVKWMGQKAEIQICWGDTCPQSEKLVKSVRRQLGEDVEDDLED